MAIVMRCLTILLLCFSVTACSTISGWFEFDDEDNPRQPAKLEKIEETVRIKKLWSEGVGDGQGNGLYTLRPALDDSNIYVASADGEVEALSRDRGKRQWDTELELVLSGGVGLYEDSLFLGSADGQLIQLDANTGELLWQRQLSGEILAPPVSNGKKVIVQTYDGKLHGLDFATGEKAWTYSSNVPVLTFRGTSSPILRSNVVYAGFANGRVLAFNADTGATMWEVRVAIAQGRSEIERIVDVDGSMALAGNELYAASYQGRIVAIDTPSGRKKWQQNISSVSGVSQGFGNVYAADDDGTVYAFLRNGQGVRWSQEALAYRGLSRPTPVSSYLAVVDYQGILHLLSQVDGEFAGRESVDGDGARADMVSDGNVLYVYSDSGKLVAYEITAKEK